MNRNRSMIPSISDTLARRMVLYAQMLDGRTKIRAGRKGVAEIVEHLGYVQIDTISVIERAHHHTLWTRISGYKPEHLHQAQAEDKTIFEYWGHAASYLPTKDYRFYLPLMESFYDPKNKWFRGWSEKFGHCLKPVLQRIREEGPLAARDFENPDGVGRGPWWDWKPAKAALELLFWRGELMIRERRGFERVYDLSERVLPSGTNTCVPSKDDLGRFLVHRAIQALGIASEREIRDYIRIGDRTQVANAIRDMLAAAEITGVKVAGQDGLVYTLPSVLEEVGRFKARTPHVYLLSPFDNLVIFRPRVKERFGFDYAFECYVPKHKRNHGYFVLPILFGEKIVGRLDPKADRAGGTLAIRRLTIEPEFADFDFLIPELSRALCDLARFNGCLSVRLEDVRPKKLLVPLKKALD